MWSAYKPNLNVQTKKAMERHGKIISRKTSRSYFAKITLCVQCGQWIRVTPQWRSTRYGKIKYTAIVQAMGAGCLKRVEAAWRKVYRVQKYRK